MLNASLERETAPVHPTKTVRFSIVTPTLNAVRFLDACLESVASQSGPGIEVEHLILDGGSTDGTLDCLRNADVRMLNRKPSDGLAQAMCLGYSEATGDLIGYLGADDVYLPGALRVVAETFRREQRGLIFGRARWTDENLVSHGELSPPPWWLTAKVHASLGWNYLGAANTFISPSLYVKLGGFREAFSKAEDYEFFTRALKQRVPFSRIDETVSLFRRHGKNSSMEHDELYFRDVRAVAAEYGPKSALVRIAYRNALKCWIYLRHPEWAYHQLRSKIGQRRLRGTS